MEIVNEFIVVKTERDFDNDEEQKPTMYIAELVEVDTDTDNIEFCIREDQKYTYIKFRFKDLQRLVGQNK